MIKSLEFLGFLNGKYNLEKEYPEQYAQFQKDLIKLDRLVNWKKTSGISGKQRSFAEAIAHDLKIDDFDISKYDRKTIKEFFDTYLEQWKALKGEKQNEEEPEMPF